MDQKTLKNLQDRTDAKLRYAEKNPKSGNIIESHFVDEFYDWLQKMKAFLLELRSSAVNNNT